MNKETIIKYFTGELSAEERIDLLHAIEHNDEWKEEFITYRNLNALVNFAQQPLDIYGGWK